MVVIKKIMRLFSFSRTLTVCGAIIFSGSIASVTAGVLPDERVDLLGHVYEGGGVEISGPSILVRKNIGSSVSVSANYYIDMVSSASIDVKASASRYTEERTEQALGIEYIHDRSTFSLHYTSSIENDYDAKTYNFGVSQTFFGDLTTVGFGLGYGEDIVGRNSNGEPDPTFQLTKERRKYTFSLNQILTKNLIAELSVDSGTDECLGTISCLNNPYRQVRYESPTGLGFQAEVYPLTHNTDAIGLRAIYHLPFRATLRGDIRQFSDSWGITAKNAELRYTQEVYPKVLVEVKYRIYSQTGADFYSDLFPYRDAQNFLARDKELSAMSDTTFSLGATYQIPWGLPGIDKSTINLYWDFMSFSFDEFRDYKEFMAKAPEGGYKVGEEPLYKFDANVIRFYLSFWF